jgi:hypothetical protein
LVNFLRQMIHSIEFAILENVSLHGFGAKSREKIIPLQYRGKVIRLLSSAWTRFPDFVQYQGHITVGALIIYTIRCSTLLHTRS